MKFIFFIFLISSAIQIINTRKPGKLTNEKKLIKYIEENYPVKWGRPVLNSSSTLYISMGLTLNMILELDAMSQTLLTSIWCKFIWEDPFLRWNPREFGGLSKVRVPTNSIYTPDIVLFNNADTRTDQKPDALAILESDGQILSLPPPTMFRSTCAINIKFFPFDRQNCSLIFGSWAYEKDLIDLLFIDNSSSIDLTEYIPSNEWKILKTEAFKNTKLVNLKNYTDISFNLILMRNGKNLTYTLIIPCLLLALLTSVVFWLPPESPSKMILGMNLFAAFFLLLLILADLIPQASNEIPMIGIYYCINMILIASSSFACTIVIHLYVRADKFCMAPKIFKVIFIEVLARFYCMLPKPEILKNLPVKPETENRNIDKTELIEKRFKKYRQNVIEYGIDNIVTANQETSCNSSIHSNTSFCRSFGQQFTISNEIEKLNDIEKDVREIIDYLRDTREKIDKKENITKLANDWKIIALVLDRTFFFIFLLITLLTLLLMVGAMV